MDETKKYPIMRHVEKERKKGEGFRKKKRMGEEIKVAIFYSQKKRRLPKRDSHGAVHEAQ